MSSSYLIGAVPIDPRRVATDLAQVEPFGFVDSYGEFVCGSWRTCVLWNAGGDSADVTIRDYHGPARITELGRKVGYVEELMTEHFDLDRLRFARLTRLTPGSVVVPHRDYVELESDLVRIHVPLVTAPEAYASETETVYRMKRGEVWFLDATRVHSIANFSGVSRIHLLLDFAATTPASVFRHPPRNPLDLPPESVIPRRPLKTGEYDDIVALARVVDPANLMDVMSVLIKRYFVADMKVLDVFAWLHEIAERSGDAAVLERARWLESHSLTTR